MGAAFVLFWSFVWAADYSVNEHPPTKTESATIQKQIQKDCKDGKYQETIERIEKCGN